MNDKNTLNLNKDEIIKTPSYKELINSQIPAIQLLVNMGYEYLSSEEALQLRDNKYRNILLKPVLEKQLREINSFEFRGKKHLFSDKNIKGAIQALENNPLNKGLVATNELIYDLLVLGKSFEEQVEGDRKSFTIQYIDWKNPENNIFHVSEEFAVERTGSKKTCKPDLVLFINGIPLIVIECKKRFLNSKASSVEQGIEQQIRNQQPDQIPRLFHFAQVLLAVSINDAKYATTGTSKNFWSFWREKEDYTENINKFILKPLSKDIKEKIFSVQNRHPSIRQDWEDIENKGSRQITEQDRSIYSLLEIKRFMKLMYVFIVFDKPTKKIARYQQYFAIQNTLKKITQKTTEGRRSGGVIWHTQGSGKSLTMVMLAKAISLHSEILNPKIIVVTDRKNLDNQISNTFKICGKTTIQAKTGKHLIDILKSPKEAIVTTVINKFEAVLNRSDIKLDSSEIFVLVDESHRTQYGRFNTNMKRVFPNACYIGFTGTPLMKKDKSTVAKFGGFIDCYTMDQAVEDGAVVPLLYEGREIPQNVDQRQIDQWFERVTDGLSEQQKRDLKNKFSTADHLNKAEQRIKQIAYDITDHFVRHWKGTQFKGQLVASNKETAIKYKKYLDEFKGITSEVVISAPDTREGGYDDPTVENTDIVQKFWKQMMEQYDSEDKYNETITDNFRNSTDPEIIIVVDKLLTGFDASKNTILYIARNLKEHNLLQAIARVNRVNEGKDYGYIVDYYGILGDLDKAITQYSALSSFEEEDIGSVLFNIRKEAEKLSQKHTALWKIFRSVNNITDIEEYEVFLCDEAKRKEFYKKLSDYTRIFGVAMSSVHFMEKTSPEKWNRYKKDMKFFHSLKNSVRRRYAETIDYKEYEPKVQKLMDSYIEASEAQSLNEPVNIFNKEAFQNEVRNLTNTGTKADTIAHRTKRSITENIKDDPAFYRRFSDMLEEVIQDWQNKRISDTEYLNKASNIMTSVRDRNEKGLPKELEGKEVAKAFYGIVQEYLNKGNNNKAQQKSVLAKLALAINEIICRHVIRDWISNRDVINQMKNDIDDFLYDLKADITLTTDQMDDIINESISIAKRRYAK